MTEFDNDALSQIEGIMNDDEMKYIYIIPDNPPDIPRKLFQCPKCNARIYIEEIDEWETETGIILSVHIDCTTVPSIRSKKWDDWFNWHWNMPCVDWMPLEIDVIEWLENNYRIRAKVEDK